MSCKVIQNNQVTISGEIVSPLTFSHEIFGEEFYTMQMQAKRTSGIIDTIPVMVSERLLDVSQSYEGEYLEVNGNFRSYNQHDGVKNRLILSVFAREGCFLEEEPRSGKTNGIYLDGYVCKEPIYRKTPLGREITDVILAVNRPYGKADYIPCIFWERNADYASKFKVGEHIGISGRIQSRKYMKKISKEEREERTAYEVSTSLVTILD